MLLVMLRVVLGLQMLARLDDGDQVCADSIIIAVNPSGLYEVHVSGTRVIVQPEVWSSPLHSLISAHSSPSVAQLPSPLPPPPPSPAHPPASFQVRISGTLLGKQTLTTTVIRANLAINPSAVMSSMPGIRSYALWTHYGARSSARRKWS